MQAAAWTSYLVWAGTTSCLAVMATMSYVAAPVTIYSWASREMTVSLGGGKDVLLGGIGIDFLLVAKGLTG